MALAVRAREALLAALPTAQTEAAETQLKALLAALPTAQTKAAEAQLKALLGALPTDQTEAAQGSSSAEARNKYELVPPLHWLTFAHGIDLRGC